jgi:hypothetical protein
MRPDRVHYGFSAEAIGADDEPDLKGILELCFWRPYYLWSASGR